VRIKLQAYNDNIRMELVLASHKLPLKYSRDSPVLLSPAVYRSAVVLE
jgi:hypothetical protein